MPKKNGQDGKFRIEGKIIMNKQKSVLVTGAASGIGRCIVDYLRERGDHVIACDVNKRGLEDLDGLERVTAIKMDVTKQKDIDKAVQLICDSNRSLDGLINNAGIGLGGPLVEIPEEDMYKQFEVNVFGVFRVTKALFPILLKNKGRIIIIGSISGLFSAPFSGPYAMSKHAIEGYSDALRREMDPLGIKVSLVEPDRVKTPIWDKTESMLSEIGNRFSPLFLERLINVMKSGIKKGRKNGLEPTTVAKKVYLALHAKRPKARYPIFKNPVVINLARHLPDSVMDAVFRKW